MDTLKIAPSSKAPRPSRARNPVGCLLRRPLVLPTLSPRNISRLIYFSAARGGPRERSRAVLFHEGNARVDKRKVMGYNSWGNLFAPERRRALGPIFIETFPLHPTLRFRYREQKPCFPTVRLRYCMPSHGETVLTFSCDSLAADHRGRESHGRVGNARGLLVISRALLLRGPASSGWNVQARLSSLRFVVRRLLER